MEVKIETFEEFYKFIEETDLTSKEISGLISRTFNCIVFDIEYTKEQYLKGLLEYWEKMKNNEENPIFFFALNLDVISKDE